LKKELKSFLPVTPHDDEKYLYYYPGDYDIWLNYNERSDGLAWRRPTETEYAFLVLLHGKPSWGRNLR